MKPSRAGESGSATVVVEEAAEHNNSWGRKKKWYEGRLSKYDEREEKEVEAKSEFEIMELKSRGKKYLEAETAGHLLKECKSRDSELSWLRTALTRGTESDKIAASIVLLQNNPRYYLSRLRWLVSRIKCGKRSQKSGITLVVSLKELFLEELLPDGGGKLRKFEEQAHGRRIDSLRDEDQRRLLADWYFEEELQREYERFVDSLLEMASDTVEANRERAISVMTDLLIGNGEQEGKLLQGLINKMGDPRSAVASKAVFSLNRVLLEHPRMKLVVMRHVEKFLFRNNIAPRAQYYAICLLTRFLLDRDHDDDNEAKLIASSLIDIYFGFFRACLKRGEPDSRMMAAILTGVNRAYPFATYFQVNSCSKLDEHIDSVYRIVHVGSFNVSLNALNLLHQVVVGKQQPERENRFYMAFYRKLVDPRLAIANKRAVFINLLYRVLRDDTDNTRLYAFLKRILQISLYFPASMACATLYVISQLFKSRKDLGKNIIGYNVRDRMLESSSSSSSDTTVGNILWNVKAAQPAEVQQHDVYGDDDDNNHVPYDPYCPNPLKSGVAAVGSNKRQTVLPWEIVALGRHFHPSVVLFANTIAEKRPIEYSGDPLTDLSLVRFLDRYAFKNPKKIREDGGARQIEDDAEKGLSSSSHPLAARRSEYIPRGLRSIPVESEAYLNEPEHRIPPDELFLYRYLRRRRNETRLLVSTQYDKDDNESVNSDEFNELLDSLGGKAADHLEDLDIAADITSSSSSSLNRRRNNKKGGDIPTSDDEESESDSYEDRSTIDEASGDDDDDDDPDYSDIDFNDDNDDSSYHRNESLPNKTNKKVAHKRSNLFVAAEEFAEILEEQARAKHKHGGSNALSVADGATTKQLDWEIARNQRIQGHKRPRNNKHTRDNKRFKKFK